MRNMKYEISVKNNFIKRFHIKTVSNFADQKNIYIFLTNISKQKFKFTNGVIGVVFRSGNRKPVVRTVVQKKCGSQLNGCIYECKLHKMLGAAQCYVSELLSIFTNY